MKIIVDTSVWIEYLKNTPGLVEKIDSALVEKNLYMVGPVVSELLQGARTEQDFDALNNSIGGVPFIEADFADWKLTGRLSYQLRRKGITVPITDCLIAAIAINNSASIYTYDRHFKNIPDIKLVELPE